MIDAMSINGFIDALSSVAINEHDMRKIRALSAIAQAAMVAILALAIPAAAQDGNAARSQARMELWQGIASGMSLLEAQTELRKHGIESKIKGDVIDVRGKVRGLDHIARLDIATVENKVFWLDVRYEACPGITSTHEEYNEVRDALSSRYGANPESISDEEIVHDSSAGLVTRKGAVFNHDGLNITLTVNRVIASGHICDNVIIRYMRYVDALAFARSENRREKREKAAQDAKNGAGL